MRSSHFVLFVLLSLFCTLSFFPSPPSISRNLFLENILLVLIPNISQTVKNLIHRTRSDPKFVARCSMESFARPQHRRDARL